MSVISYIQPLQNKLTIQLTPLIHKYDLHSYTTPQLTAIAITVLVAIYVLFKLILAYIQYKRLDIQLSSIPTPPSRYPFSQFVDLVSDNPWRVLYRWMQQLNSRMIRFQFGSYTYIVVSDPNVIKHVMTSTKSSSQGDFMYQKDLAAMSSFLPILGNGLVTSRGLEWHKQSSLIAPVLRSDILQDTAKNSIDACDRLVNKMIKSMNQNINNPDYAVGICDEFRHLTLQVIGKSILSLSAHECSSTFPDLYLPIADEANTRVYFPIKKYLPYYSNYTYSIALNELNRFVSNKIESRYDELQQLGKDKLTNIQQTLNNSQNDTTINNRSIDILDRILLQMLVNNELWNKYTINALRDQIKTFVLAGHETTSMMLTWSLWELIQNKECMSKAVKAAKELWGTLTIDDNGNVTSSKNPSFDDINKLDYNMAVLREALRLWSVVPLVVREAQSQDTLPHVDGIGQVTIPKGALIAINVYAVHHQDDNNETYGWIEPEKFNPDRFLDNKSLSHSYRFMAFIQGPRKCIGQHFALLEAKIVLSRIILLFDIVNSSVEQGKYHKFNIPITPDERMKIHYKLRDQTTV